MKIATCRSCGLNFNQDTGHACKGMFRIVQKQDPAEDLQNQVQALAAKLKYALARFEEIAEAKNYAIFTGEYAPTNEAEIAMRAIKVLKAE